MHGSIREAIEKATKLYGMKEEKYLCKKHSLSYNIGAIEAILQRRYDKHSVNDTSRKNGCRTCDEEKRIHNL